MNRGKLIILSGPSGSGKGTVVKELVRGGDFVVSISATTRSPRDGEVDGVNYYFLSKAEFEEKISADGFLEYAQYNGNYYGTPKKPVYDKLEEGINVILEIEVQGALKVKEVCSDALMIMISPPTYENLEKRLRGRGDTKEEDIIKRLAIAKTELETSIKYDYLVLNRDNLLDETVKVIREIANGVEHSECKTINNADFIDKFYANK